MKHTEINRKFYDYNVEEYMKKTLNLRDDDWLEKFVNNLPQKGKILDIGCAYGRDCKYFSEQGFSTWGIDISEKMIEKAKKFDSNSNFKMMNVLDLKFEDDFFNGVWCSACLIHLKKDEITDAVEEIARVLRPGGVLYVNFKEGRGEEFIQDERYGGQKKFYSYFLKKEIEDLLKKYGFSILEMKKIVRNEDYFKGERIIYIIAEHTTRFK